MTLPSDYLRDCNVVIIGAGAIGSALTYRLAQAGARVTTVERRYPGSGTTGKSFAWLNGNNKHPRDYHRLNVMSIRDCRDLADEVGGQWLSITGSLHCAPDDHGLAKSLRQNMRQLRDWGLQVDEVTPETAIRELEPDLEIDSQAVSTVYFVSRDGWVDAVSMVQDLIHAATYRYAATVVRGTVTGFRMQGQIISGVLLDTGDEVPADVVINCAGPDAASIGALAHANVPVVLQPGVLVVTGPAPCRLRRVVRTPAVSMRPDGGSRLLLRPERVDDLVADGQDIGLESAIVRDTMAAARKLVPSLSLVDAETVRLGVKVIPNDGFPIVGFHPAAENLYIVVTHSGITLCARLGLLVSQELAGNESQELEPYRPTRFPLSADIG